MKKKQQITRNKRKYRVRKKIVGEGKRKRLSVFRSNRYLYGQIVDDIQKKTLVAVSEKELGERNKKGTKIERAKLLGESLAKKALKQKIKQVFFDRGAYRYHGRIRAFAKGAREGGLDF